MLSIDIMLMLSYICEIYLYSLKPKFTKTELQKSECHTHTHTHTRQSQF